MAAEPRSSAVLLRRERLHPGEHSVMPQTQFPEEPSPAQYLPEVSSRGTQVQEAALVEVVSWGTPSGRVGRK